MKKEIDYFYLGIIILYSIVSSATVMCKNIEWFKMYTVILTILLIAFIVRTNQLINECNKLKKKLRGDKKCQN